MYNEISFSEQLSVWLKNVYNKFNNDINTLSFYIFLLADYYGQRELGKIIEFEEYHFPFARATQALSMDEETQSAALEFLEEASILNMNFKNGKRMISLNIAEVEELDIEFMNKVNKEK
jgi:hypothetical protein